MALSRFQEHRPMMLKDFLRNDSFNSCTLSSSSSSSGFPTKPSAVLLSCRSKKAAAATISAVHKVVNVVRFFHFASVKSPLVLPRSISRKLLTKRSSKDKKVILGDATSPEVKFKVKDILRWRSFRDVVEDDPTPLDFQASPDRSATTTATTSKRSSWCDSDFTAEELPPWGGEKCFLGQPPTLRNPKGDWSFAECEQQSPVSVLDSPFREVFEDPISRSPFHPILANVERAKCMLTRRIQEFEDTNDPEYTRNHSFVGSKIPIFECANAIEEKAKQLLNLIQEHDTRSHANDYNVILDSFVHELSLNGNLHDLEFDSEILRIAKSWIDGEYDDEFYEWEREHKRESYVKDMEKGVCWKRFEEEQEEMSKELEVEVLDELVDELLADLRTN